jgi:hypothetical protein
MTDKKHAFELEAIGLPALRLVLGEVPSPNPETRRKMIRDPKTDRVMVVNVRKLIAHLTESIK